MTTSKHINYVAREYGYPVQDAPKDQAPDQKADQAADPLADQMRSVAMVCAFGQILCNTPEEKNSWNKRMLGTLPGISFPADFDSLPEDEKARRLDAAVNQIKEKKGE